MWKHRRTNKEELQQRICNDSTDVVSYIFNGIEIVQHVYKDYIQATDVIDANVIDVDWFKDITPLPLFK